jgi:hypothetical protein
MAHWELEDCRAYISKMDFSSIAKKLMRPDPNISRVWSEKSVQEAIQQYKDWLFLVRKHFDGGNQLPPSLEVDEIWHHHILDTRAYTRDCQAIFGEYLHHFPYFGLRGKEDAAALASAFQRTQEAYFAEYGEYLYEIDPNS